MWLFCFSQHHLLRTTVLSPTEGFWHRVENHVTIYARVHFWSLSSIPQFTYLPVCQCQTILMTLAQLCVFWNYVESCLYSWGSCWVGFFLLWWFFGFFGFSIERCISIIAYSSICSFSLKYGILLSKMYLFYCWWIFNSFPKPMVLFGNRLLLPSLLCR